MIKDFIWVFYSAGALIGLLSRDHMDANDPDAAALNAGRYADKMLDEWKNRYEQGYKGR